MSVGIKCRIFAPNDLGQNLTAYELAVADPKLQRVVLARIDGL